MMSRRTVRPPAQFNEKPRMLIVYAGRGGGGGYIHLKDIDLNSVIEDGRQSR